MLKVTKESKENRGKMFGINFTKVRLSKILMFVVGPGNTQLTTRIPTKQQTTNNIHGDIILLFYCYTAYEQKCTGLKTKSS
jgi:hypothetical protein